jgi:acetyl esterase/lipase
MCISLRDVSVSVFGLRARWAKCVVGTVLTTIAVTTSATGQSSEQSGVTEPDHPPAISLWPNGAPGFENMRNEKEVVTKNGTGRTSWYAVSNVHNPSIVPYLPAPDTATGIAVVIAPGGGHRILAISHEGYNVGQWLADHGIAAFVLKYRLEKGTSGANYTHEKEALADIQRAIRFVRHRAHEWHINPDAIGVIGFSAGGEMAALAAQQFDDGESTAADPIDRVSSKPSFQALIYPGRSQQFVPDKDSPPAFLVCAFDDRRDISAGLADLYLRFHEAGVPAELHIYSSGGHGFGLRTGVEDRPVHAWPARFVEWLSERGFSEQRTQPQN